MAELVNQVFDFIVQARSKTTVSAGELEIWAFVKFLVLVATLIFVVMVIIKVLFYLKRIAVALENNNYAPKPNKGAGIDDVVCGGGNKKNVFTTDIGDLLKK